MTALKRQEEGFFVKTAVLIPLTLLVGLMVGAWPLRSRLQRSQARIEELEALLRDQSPRRGGVPLSALSPIINLSDSGTNRSAEASTTNATSQAGVTNAVAASSTNRTNRASRHSLSNQLERAASMWRIRADVARAAAIQEMGLNHRQANKFDVMVEAMNIRMRERFAYWADAIRASDVMTEELGVRMMNDLSEVMVLTYDEFDRNLPEGWRDRTTEGVRLTDFVDPSVAEPLIGVEDKLDEHRERQQDRR